jgi:hypothetical protein
VNSIEDIPKIIPMKDRGTLSSTDLLFEIYLSTNELQTHRDKYCWDTRILDAEYKEEYASIGNVIKICQNFHVWGQHQL